MPPQTAFTGPEQFTIVDIPGVGEVEFPVTMSAEEVNRAAKTLYDKAKPWSPGADSLSGAMTRPPQVLSDTPPPAKPAPDAGAWAGLPFIKGLISNFNPTTIRDTLLQSGALQPLAHPETAGDVAGLMIPGVGVEGAVAREGPGLLRGIRQAPATAVGGAARVAEAGGRVSPSTGAIIGGFAGNVGGMGGQGAAIGAAAPAASRAVGRGLRRGQRILGGGKPKFMEPPVYPVGTPDLGPPEPPWMRPPEYPVGTPDLGPPEPRWMEPPVYPPETPPSGPPPPVQVPPDAPILRKAGEARPSTAATVPQREVIADALDDLLAKEHPVAGTTPPEPTITTPGKEGEFQSTGRPSATAEQQAGAEGWAGMSRDNPVPRSSNMPEAAPVVPETPTAAPATPTAVPETPVPPPAPPPAVPEPVVPEPVVSGAETPPPSTPAAPATDATRQLHQDMVETLSSGDPSDPAMLQALKDLFGGKMAGQIAGVPVETTGKFPIASRSRIDTWLKNHPTATAEELQTYVHAKGSNAVSRNYIAEQLKAAGKSAEEIAEAMKPPTAASGAAPAAPAAPVATEPAASPKKGGAKAKPEKTTLAPDTPSASAAATETTRETVAHRGYLIKTNPFNGLIWIEKDGMPIGKSYKTAAEAKAQIDSLLD